MCVKQQVRGHRHFISVRLMVRRGQSSSHSEIDLSHVGGGPGPLALHLLPLLRGPRLEAPPQPLAQGQLDHLAVALQRHLAETKDTWD